MSKIREISLERTAKKKESRGGYHFLAGCEQLAHRWYDECIAVWTCKNGSVHGLHEKYGNIRFPTQLNLAIK